MISSCFSVSLCVCLLDVGDLSAFSLSEKKNDEKREKSNQNGSNPQVANDLPRL